MVALYIIFGILAGVLGGMGMGGGTLLIPLFSFTDLSQQTIQGINLISFIPMAIASLYVHKHNGLICIDRTNYMIYPAVISAIIGAVLANFVGNEILKISFGTFLILLSLVQIVALFKIKKGET